VKARRPAPEPASAERLIEVLGDELYAAPSWALFREVRSIIRAGVSDTRLADAIAVHMTPGPWRLHRIEVKRSRKDWVVELRDPGKAEEIARFCAASYIVVPAPAKKIILTVSELPSGTGLIEVHGSRAKILVHAVEVPVAEPPPGLLKSLLKSAVDAAVREQIGEGDAPLRTIVDDDGRYVVLSCGDRQLRPLTKKQETRVACWDCAERAAASGPGLARVAPAPLEEVAHVG
jgi:hypothetical protein